MLAARHQPVPPAFRPLGMGAWLLDLDRGASGPTGWNFRLPSPTACAQDSPRDGDGMSERHPGTRQRSARGAVAVGSPILELYLTLAVTAAVAALTGLAMSATARSHDQILPMLVISVMLSMVFCGGMIPVTGRPILDQLSWAIPARWGFAATASTTDLRAIAPLTPQNETLWSHDPGRWLLNMTLLIALGAVLAGCVRWRTRLGAAPPISHRSAGQRWLRAFRPVPMPHRPPRPEHTTPSWVLPVARETFPCCWTKPGQSPLDEATASRLPHRRPLQVTALRDHRWEDCITSPSWS
jgi:hypothetical protein